jgi:DNA repair exonuclease SbcCD ATPase subunit
MNAVNRNGIPYMILRKVLPIIESEVNEILNGIVDFSFRIEIGENDEIDGSIVYGDRTWAIELSSGMERFILSLAIRCSLIRLSNLPKPNFLAIDEGFGVLDSDKLHSIKLFFEFLKSTFDFVLCISHISEMRDYVDQLISINKTNGFSKIQVT